jgi:hypothetical protein
MSNPFRVLPGHRALDRAQRGVSLLAVLIVIVVVTTLVASAVTFTGQESTSANRHLSHESLSSCSLAARNYVLAQLRTGALGRLRNPQIAGELDTGEFLIRTGHMGEGDGGSFAPAMRPCLGSGNGDPNMSVYDLTNSMPGLPNGGGAGFGSQCLNLVAHCLEKQSGAVGEVEFQVRLAF